MNFTGCIIAKNEEKHIAGAIRSLLPICSQIVVVDTGSIDDTPKIAANSNCEIYFKKWNNDFSEMRNFALGFARSHWIIFLDADEVLLPFSSEQNQKIFQDDRIGGVSCIIKNYLTDDRTSFIEHRYTRIFRNHPKIRYQGAVHEQISESIFELGLEIIEADITIEHFGYIDNSTEKKQRNLELIKKELAQNPSDYLLFHLANTEFSMNNLITAKEIFLKILSSRDLSVENLELSQLRLFQIATSLNDWKYILEHQNYVFSNSNYEGLKQFILAACFMHRKQWEKAYHCLLSAEKCNSSLVDRELLRKSIEAVEKYIDFF
ncbi:MAG TPA: glycosyltransferase family 2 protein [Candidatus Kapabacteria bacterium]|jgi:glycosyltransferase involved in cell wall biosynthesis|nr:glycosyltransferase family 2 protein [Candidatus Kapabacteria bacterium]HOM05524.1 glycosyltransferase family 2 protein [Candidatus Kapabacteria bacterium]HPP39084.1 glycosyltransferase family 2 protein [Candidatus Kapabacteria bacterium]HPU22878.1 glycosyltransferase family 2 protein [Candidatus Kapabacteria bacterium]